MGNKKKRDLAFKQLNETNSLELNFKKKRSKIILTLITIGVFASVICVVVFISMFIIRIGLRLFSDYSMGIGELCEDNTTYKLHSADGKEVFWTISDMKDFSSDSIYGRYKVVLLRNNPVTICKLDPSISDFATYKYIVNQVARLPIASNTLNYAIYNQKHYFDEFGLTLLYNSCVTSSNGQVVSLIYNDIFENNRLVTISTLENYSVGDIIVLKENLNKYIDNTITLVPDVKLNDIKTVGVMFKDTIVSYDYFFAEAPQYKHFFSEPYYDLLTGNYVGVANYWETKSYGGRVRYDYPVLFYTDQFGCVREEESPTKLEIGDLTKMKQGVLIDFSSQQIINKELTTKERMKYKYPVLMFHGQEIGNNSYNYAKIETKRFILNYGLKLAYLAHVDSKQRDVIVDNVNLTFRDMAGNLQKTTCHIPQTYQEYDSLIIYSTDQGYKAAELKFDTEVNFNKIRQGRAYIFRDTLVTESELINDIPDMKQHVEQFLERMKEGK